MNSPSVSYCSSPVLGRDPELGMSFNDNDRDNIEEKSDIEVIGERREGLGDDSDYGGSGDLENQVSIWFSSCHKLSLNQ